MTRWRTEGRRQAALFAIRSHGWAKGNVALADDSAIVDLLIDLRYYCEAHTLDFDLLNDAANAHWLLGY